MDVKSGNQPQPKTEVSKPAPKVENPETAPIEEGIKASISKNNY